MRVCYEFEVKPGKEAALESFYYASMRPHVQQMQGYQEEVLLRLAGSEGKYMILGHWTSLELFDHWRNAPEHKLAVQGFSSFFAGKPRVSVYEEVSPTKST
jgi:heme-degrading monooxygenase HmoA